MLLKLFSTFLLIFLLNACADNQKKLKVTGAQVSSDVEEEEIVKSKSVEKDSSIEISDESSDTRNEKSLILTEALIEVGDRVYFDYDKSNFKDTGVETLKRQARFLLKNPDLTVTIEGHCDQRGTREYNLALGERRAYAVKSFLVTLGLDKNRISVISYGKEKPQSQGDNEEAWSSSRTAITVINP